MVSIVVIAWQGIAMYRLSSFADVDEVDRQVSRQRYLEGR